MIILRPKNVIFERFWPLSKFHFPACSTLVIYLSFWGVGEERKGNSLLATSCDVLLHDFLDFSMIKFFCGAVKKCVFFMFLKNICFPSQRLICPNTDQWSIWLYFLFDFDLHDARVLRMATETVVVRR